MYSYALMVPMNQRVLNKARNKRGSLLNIHITLLDSLNEHSLVYWYQQNVTVYHFTKYISCHEAIVVITRRVHCFYDYVHINNIKYILFQTCQIHCYKSNTDIDTMKIRLKNLAFWQSKWWNQELNNF